MVGLTDRPDMTSAVYRGVKHNTTTTKFETTNFYRINPGAMRSTSCLHRISAESFSLSEYTYGRVARPLLKYTLNEVSPDARST